MPTTLNKISEQIWRLAKGGTPSDDTELTLREVRELVIQNINKKLKAEHLSVHQAYGEHFPPHHLIATYEGIDVTYSETPTTEITCTPMPNLVVTSVEMTIEHLLGDPDYFLITITGVEFSGVTAEEIESFVNTASESCVLTFGSGGTEPASFLIVGIEDFTVDGTTITFNYYPDAVPDTGFWTTGDGLFWVTNSGLFWTVPTSSSGYVIPEILEEYLQNANFYLNSVPVGDSYTLSFNFTTLSICCIVSDETDIDAVATLPAQPISLPRGMGIWRVYRPNAPNDPFIPLSSQVMSIARNITHTNMNGVFGAVTAYEYINNTTIRFNQPSSVIGATVDMQLLVIDYAASPDSILPIPADMEDMVIRETLDLLRIQPPLDKNNDENDQR